MPFMQIAEDIASDTFLTAVETWSGKGVPPNPEAWLHHVAKNKARNYLKRDTLFEAKIAPELAALYNDSLENEIDLSEQNMEDSQLQMMFAICHPSIAAEAQVGLALRILCGFGINEIAAAFLTEKETINKRLYRAKEKLRDEKIEITLPPASELSKRLDNVLATLYLLFNEGYYSAANDVALRKDLCIEAIRLTYALTENALTNRPEANALLALMCFHASRFEARFSATGDIILYDEQDTNLWNDELIKRGNIHMDRSIAGDSPTRYHLEAAIASWHTIKQPPPEKWQAILVLYNKLLDINPSPVVSLNRVYAYWKVNGAAAALTELMGQKLPETQFYYTLLGDLYAATGSALAADCYHKALKFTNNIAEAQFIRKKLQLAS